MVAFATVLLGFAAKTTVSRIRRFSPRYQFNDFRYYYAWSLEYRAGELPWRPVLAPGYLPVGRTRTLACNYTPFFVESTSWLAYFPQETAHYVWEYFQVGCLALAIALLARGFEPPLGPAATIALISGALFSQSFRILLFYGQVAPMLLLGLAGAWLAIKRRNPPVAGFCLAIVTLLKLYPGILGGYLLLRRKWRELGWMAAFLALGLFASGLKSWLAFARYSPAFSIRAMENFHRPLAIKYRASLLEFSYIAASWLTQRAAPPVLVIALVSVISGAAALAVLLWATWRAGESETNAEGLVFALWIAAEVIFSPLSWVHEFPLLIPAYMFAAAIAYRAVREGARDRLALAVGVLMLAVCIVPELVHQLPLLRPPYLVPIFALIGGALMLEARPMRVAS
ncbi:MAG TPA: glycosyltransferase family 87 protein [Candidatus Binataceae bacterium]|nr:glycosyltransferase family 87 protein [Candidatus Binataceae bacterium]